MYISFHKKPDMNTTVQPTRMAALYLKPIRPLSSISNIPYKLVSWVQFY